MYKVDGKLIRALMLKRSWGIADLSKATHLHTRTCRKLLDGDAVNLKTIATAALAFNVDGEELILKEN